MTLMRTLTYTLGLNADQRRTELGRHIRIISAHTGVTHTRAFRWGIELNNDDIQAQGQASVCEVHLPLNIFLNI